MTAVLHHTRYPSMRILVPQTGEIKQFRRVHDELGVLVLNEDDPAFELVMSIARRDPAIKIITTGILTCECGVNFTGKMARALLAKHQKTTGHQAVQAQPDLVAKQSARWSCPIDLQEFGTEVALVAHTEKAHAPKPPKEEPAEGDLEPGAIVVGTLTTNAIPPARPSGK
jgi:hypothetical protein